uniref:Speckle-type POZ protein (inferred by orthology to a human protein) n=1 Tax=Strongyloides venezuelensis TaxID=75913 RepID=A0A0K0F2X1_STRVS
MDLENLGDSNFDCNTKNNVKRASFTCSIENFSRNKNVFTPCGKYFIEYDSNNDDYDCVYGYDAESKGYVTLFLEFNEFSCLKILTLCNFSVSRIDGKNENKSIVGVENFDAKKSSYCLKKFIDRNNLFKNASTLLPNDRLTVCIEMFYLCGDVNTSDVSEATNIGEPLNVFLKDISRLLDSSEFYDCVIKVRDSEINVHKCIIATRSEIFRSTLKKNSLNLNQISLKLKIFVWKL